MESASPTSLPKSEQITVDIVPLAVESQAQQAQPAKKSHCQGRTYCTAPQITQALLAFTAQGLIAYYSWSNFESLAQFVYKNYPAAALICGGATLVAAGATAPATSSSSIPYSSRTIGVIAGVSTLAGLLIQDQPLENLIIVPVVAGASAAMMNFSVSQNGLGFKFASSMVVGFTALASLGDGPAGFFTNVGLATAVVLGSNLALRITDAVSRAICCQPPCRSEASETAVA